MKVIVGCETSGAVRDAMKARGHYAVSCDLLPTDAPGLHFQGDIFELLEEDDWDMMIVHPPCTFLCSSGLHWNGRIEGRAEKTAEALEFVRRLLGMAKTRKASRRRPIPKIALENPVGCISTEIMPATQYIQPYNFGHNASKKTGLWLTGLPPLVGTSYFPPRIVEGGKYDGKKRWGNQTDSGQNNTPGGSKGKKSETQWKIRSETYTGIAEAMAAQWG